MSPDEAACFAGGDDAQGAIKITKEVRGLGKWTDKNFADAVERALGGKSYRIQ
jgi:hypothetical protein